MITASVSFLKSLKIDPKLTNITSKEIGRELYIENEFHKAKGFRKLHIEVAEFSKNLKILHCVFFLIQSLISQFLGWIW